MYQVFYEGFANKRRVQLINTCIQAIHQGTQVYYILPSREAMYDTRKKMTDPMGGIFNCQIFGFNDFEKLVIGEATKDKKQLNQMEQRILIKCVLEDLPQSNLFSLVKDKPGFMELLLSTIRQMKRLYLSPSQFQEATMRLTGSIGKKCVSFYDIYQAYEDLKKQKTLYDENDFALEAVEAAKGCALLDAPSLIVIDGFINIDPVNLALVESIRTSHPEVDIIVNVPFKNIHNEYFIQQEILKDFAHFEKMEDTELEKNLSQSLYSGKPVEHMDTNQLEIVNSPCMDHEIRRTAEICRELLLEGQIQPSDLMITLPDVNAYKAKLICIFEEYGLSVNLKEKTPITSVPVIKDLLAFWQLWRHEEIQNAFGVVMTSKYLLPIETLEQHHFETDALWDEVDLIFAKYETEHYFAKYLELWAIDKPMEAYVLQCQEFTSCRDKDPVEAIDAFIALFEKLQVEAHILRLYQENLIDETLLIRDLTAVQSLKSFFVQIRELFITMEVKGQMSALLQELFDMLSEIEIRQPGRNVGGIPVMPPDLIRGLHFHTVFALGMNEGHFPGKSGRRNLFDSDELQKLEQVGVHLPNDTWELEREKIRFNSIIAAADQKLYLSYRTADEDGSIMIASPLMEEVLTLLPPEAAKKVVEPKVSMRDRLKRLADSPTMRTTYARHGAKVEYIRDQVAAYTVYDGKLERPQLLKSGKEYTFSASKLNDYSRCPFGYFAKAILNLESIDERSRERMDIGTFYHEVLRKYHQQVKDPRVADLTVLDEMISDSIGELELVSIPQPMLQFELDQMCTKLREFIVFDAENIKRYYDVKGFMMKPTLFEKAFSFMEGDNLFKGVIDRIDLEIDGNGHYTGRYMLIDYKKGNAKGIKESIEGVDHQLSLYNFAMEKILCDELSLKNPECVALLYYGIEGKELDGWIRKDYKKALFKPRQGTTSTLGKTNMEILMEWAVDNAEAVTHDIRLGKFMPPKECPGSYYGCDYAGLCRYNRIKMENKKEEPLC